MSLRLRRGYALPEGQRMVNFRNKTRDQTAFRPVAQHHIFPVRHQQIGGVVSAKQFHIQALAQIDIIEGISAFAILPVGITDR